MQRLGAAFEEIASDGHLVEHHAFDNGVDNGPYFNYTFGTRHALQLWESIQARIYNSNEFGADMKLASTAVCSSEEGWDNYLQLFHFDRTVKLDATTNL